MFASCRLSRIGHRARGYGRQRRGGKRWRRRAAGPAGVRGPQRQTAAAKSRSHRGIPPPNRSSLNGSRCLAQQNTFPNWNRPWYFTFTVKIPLVEKSVWQMRENYNHIKRAIRDKKLNDGNEAEYQMVGARRIKRPRYDWWIVNESETARDRIVRFTAVCWQTRQAIFSEQNISSK